MSIISFLFGKKKPVIQPTISPQRDRAVVDRELIELTNWLKRNNHLYPESDVVPVVVSKPAPITIPRVQTPIPEFYCLSNLEPSPAEKIIADLLKFYRVTWFREVCFNDLPSSKNGHYRFDFFLPEHKLIIEYDGKQWHNSPERLAVDAIKTTWCSDNDIRIVRFSSKHYYEMATHIDKLMKEYNIKRSR